MAPTPDQPERRDVPGWLRTALELGPVALFFLAYISTRGQTYTLGGTEYSAFILVTAGFIPLIIVATIVLWRLTGHLSVMQIVTAVLVTIFGGLTVWLNDERFLKMKPTLIYSLFAAILGFGLLRGRSYLSMVLASALPLTDEGWMILTKRMAIFFVALAMTNEVVWRTLSTDAWVNFRTFGLPVLFFAFLMSQAGLLKRHSTEEES
ncbi:inner membrane-spanning protein YciB [Jannaschia aquimarina]|uniref:Inner membrane-spanning protein YciB n=1 Tax=Jannaschia aquimarina TaxID=935700 RepID=A0A0D1EQ24_9RHOB|nr:inner membrane-spanning protein YciB [Jannaschia aquimarina]KIT17715.1 Intracellular septation protein [Jannaschia aquimarina]SNS78320.1 intracellular septation protein [Jannaschia aquimarina]